MEYIFPEPQLDRFAEFYFFEHIFHPSEVDRITKMWNVKSAKDATMSSGEKVSEEDELRKSSVQFLDNNEDNRWIYDKLAMVVQHCNMHNYGFDLNGFAEKLQLTQYGKGDHFNWHLDFGPREISHRKLSITVQLSDPTEYEGGELQFRLNDKDMAAPKSKGTVIVFPSFIQHRVARIEQGVRRSIVGWASGKPYR